MIYSIFKAGPARRGVRSDPLVSERIVPTAAHALRWQGTARTGARRARVAGCARLRTPSRGGISLFPKCRSERKFPISLLGNFGYI